MIHTTHTAQKNRNNSYSISENTQNSPMANTNYTRMANYNMIHTLTHQLKNMRQYAGLAITALFLLFGGMQDAQAQACGYVAGESCSTTDYSNYGLNSNNDAASIEYDNFTSGFHQTVARTSSGNFMIWGEKAANDGVSNVLSAQEINRNKYPALGTHKVLKVTLSSDGISQFIALTTDGLYAWSGRTRVSDPTPRTLSSALKSGLDFSKVGPTNGNNYSLPPGISPSDVKMFTASPNTLVITTCSGDVWVLSNSLAADASRGNGGTYSAGDDTKWSRVQTSSGVYLTGVVSTRVFHDALIALKSDGTLWTWGVNTYLGDGSAVTNRSFATQMNFPDSGKQVKMIGITGNYDSGTSTSKKTYFVLMTDGNLYALGYNENYLIGDFTNTERTSWVQPKYGTAGPVMNNISWISPNEHDTSTYAINVITNVGKLYAWGNNSASSIGRGIANNLNTLPGIPSGIQATDRILAVTTGGHTSMVVKECEDNVGYVGHRVDGSMGNGSSDDLQEISYTFTNTPVLTICGAEALFATVSTPSNPDGTYCINKGPLTLVGYPAGGTFSIVSGTGATLSGTGNNQLTFSATSSVTLSVKYDATSTCGTAVSTTFTIRGVVCCLAGNDAPTFSSGTTFTNTCPANTVDLTSYTASNLPSGAKLTWHTGTPATTANKLTDAQIKAVVGGTYYAAFFDATNNCYSGTSGNGTTGILVTINSCGTNNYCGYVAGEGCSTTDYSNYGLRSNSDAASIEYDNFVSGYHSTIVRTSNGKFMVWGEDIGNDGTTDVLSPLELNSTNYPALSTYKVLKVTMGGSGYSQFIALTTDGLYAWGYTGYVLSTSLKSTTAFGKVGSTNANNYSLPPGLSPKDVKMMTASFNTLLITTCSGEVWVLSNATAANASRGNGGLFSATEGDASNWAQVKTAVATPLTGIISARVYMDGAIALKSDGTLYTWGVDAYLGNAIAKANRNFATQMTFPATGKKVKMIGITGKYISSTVKYKSYHVLMTDGSLYTLGGNNNKELGDWTTTERTSWVQPRYTSTTGLVMDNISWVAPQEHDYSSSATNVITNTGNLYAWGNDNSSAIGRGGVSSADPGIPAGISSTDKILAVNTGGHTTMVVKDCEDNVGYVGHLVSGSMGNSSALDAAQASYTFTNTPVIAICGAETVSATVSTPSNPDGTYCINKGPLTLVGYPAGGTFSLVSGTGASLSGTGNNQLSFSAAGTVTLSLKYDAISSCGTAVSTTFTMTGVVCCLAGDAAPNLSASTLTNPCTKNSVDLTTITASNKPTNTILTWHTATPATNANKIPTADLTSRPAGTYHAAFFDAAFPNGGCYSGGGAATTPVVATINVCTIVSTPSQIETVTGSTLAGKVPVLTSGKGGFTYSDGSDEDDCEAPAGFTSLTEAGGTVNGLDAATGEHTITAPTEPGNYFYCIKVCGSNGLCTVSIHKVVVTEACPAGTVAPVTKTKD